MLQPDTINNWFMAFTAGSVLIAVPITLLFIFMQKYYVEGITGGSVK
ncbi:maltose transporter permease [Chlamydia trachomatis]|nr:maltose transporter permease [Chlamydia trachomatis]